MVQLTSRSLCLDSRTENLQVFREFVREAIRDAQLSTRMADHVVLATDEALTSIVRHASENARVGEIEVAIDVDQTRIKVSIGDSGNNFDPGVLSASEVQELIERGRSLEMGIFLIRAVMDELSYVYRRGFENRFEMVKFNFE